MREGALPDFLALGVNEGDRGARNRVSGRSERGDGVSILFIRVATKLTMLLYPYPYMIDETS